MKNEPLKVYGRKTYKSLGMKMIFYPFFFFFLSLTRIKDSHHIAKKGTYVIANFVLMICTSHLYRWEAKLVNWKPLSENQCMKNH